MRTSEKKKQQLTEAVGWVVDDFRSHLQTPGLQLSFESLDRLLIKLRESVQTAVVRAYETPVNPRRIKPSAGASLEP